jgi:hypothetical protein
VNREPRIRSAARDEPAEVPIEVWSEPATDPHSDEGADLGADHGGDPAVRPATEAADDLEPPAGATLLGDSVGPRRRPGRITAVLIGLAIIAIGFLAGAQIQKRYSADATTATTGAPAGLSRSGFPGGGGFGGPGGGGASSAASASAATTGTVERVDGDTVYLKLPSGTVIAVKTDGSTAVDVSSSASASALTPGASVSVQGQSNDDGSITASRITRAN